jgi:hypothetical protein
VHTLQSLAYSMDRRANADGFCSPFCFCVFFRSLECVGDVGGRLAVVSFLSFLFSLLSQVSFFAVFPTDLYVLDVFSIKYNPVNYILPPHSRVAEVGGDPQCGRSVKPGNFEPRIVTG